MLEKYYIRPTTIDRIHKSWIASAVEQYVSWMAERRYTGRIDRVTGTAQQLLHLACPFLLLDFHQGFKFAQMVGIRSGDLGRTGSGSIRLSDDTEHPSIHTIRSPGA